MVRLKEKSFLRLKTSKLTSHMSFATHGISYPSYSLFAGLIKVTLGLVLNLLKFGQRGIHIALTKKAKFSWCV